MKAQNLVYFYHSGAAENDLLKDIQLLVAGADAHARTSSKRARGRRKQQRVRGTWALVRILSRDDIAAFHKLCWFGLCPIFYNVSFLRAVSI